MPQFNRVVQQAGSGDAPITAREQLRNCMDLTKTGQLVGSTINDPSIPSATNLSVNASAPSATNLAVNGSAPNGVCNAQSTPWQNWQVTSQAWGIPSYKCTDYQNAFAASSQNCMSSIGRAKEWIKIAAGVGGAIAGLCLCYAAYRFCKKRCDERRTSTFNYSSMA